MSNTHKRLVDAVPYLGWRGAQFVVYVTASFRAGSVYQMFRQHANGGGFCIDFVEQQVLDDGGCVQWVIREKHQDGDVGLARALPELLSEGFEFTDAAKAEIDRRTRAKSEIGAHGFGRRDPIYVEYYVHGAADYYKLALPWPQYRTHVVVLCPVSDGRRRADTLARRTITVAFERALEAARL